MLICRKRFAFSERLKEQHQVPSQLPVNSEPPEYQITSEILYLPVAIVLTSPLEVLYGLEGNAPNEHRKWIINDIKTRGLGLRAARAALAAAWRGVDEIGSNWPDQNRLRFKYRAPHRALGINTGKPQDLTLLRDVALWINWNHWEDRKVPLKRRAEILVSWGFPCTMKALRQVKDAVGI